MVSERCRRGHEVAAGVADPELPMLTIADLGILREVTEGSDGAIEVVITPTYCGCPAMDMIAGALREALEEAGLGKVRVRTRLAPAWTTDWMTAEAKRKLAEAGIAPPSVTAPVCPRCGSERTEVLSVFGSTACKALWRCLVCGEPFERFKCH